MVNPTAHNAGVLHRPARRLSLPQSVRGRYRTIKTMAATALLALYFFTPWVRWDRGPLLPDQAVLFDISGRRLFVFNLEFWPQDLPIAVGALVLAAFGLFSATTVAGRVWCGFTCPQTVWTDLFFAIDRICERFLGRATLGSNIAKTSLWIVVSVLTAFGFAAYFNDAPSLPSALAGGTAPTGAYIAIGVLTLTTWLLAAYARERVCLHMCPWPRFQAALLDKDSLVVTYLRWRGDPRGKKKIPLRGDLKELSLPVYDAKFVDGERGDCIDCLRCVNVCPTGIDIRDGLQMGCIGCGLCIDACDDVMTKIDRPRGLIRFDVEGADRVRSTEQPTLKLLRPKALLYAILALLALSAMTVGIATMDNVVLDVEPQRNPPFVQLSDGSVRNDFSVRIAHRLRNLSHVRITTEGLPSATLSLTASEQSGPAIAVDIGNSRQFADRMFVTVPHGRVPAGRATLRVVFTDRNTGSELGAVDTYFWGPSR